MPIRRDAKGRFASGGSIAPGGKRGGSVGRAKTATRDRGIAETRGRIKAAGGFPIKKKREKAASYDARVTSHVRATGPKKGQERAAHDSRSSAANRARHTETGDRKALKRAVGKETVYSKEGKRVTNRAIGTSAKTPLNGGATPRKPRSVGASQTNPLMRAGSRANRNKTFGPGGAQNAKRASANQQNAEFKNRYRGGTGNKQRKRLKKG